ncbi:hypothetical protein ACFQ3K_16745 [Brucella gallinifaecis]|uniref:hypothetical protein n=1 Tax=Brucella gallinifaecis TaxID=215590 RepID=UPI001AED7B94|nr:hypothetical protein [Brucella gallinifaecis]
MKADTHIKDVYMKKNLMDVSVPSGFETRPAEIRQLLRGELEPGRSQELLDEMRAAGLPT